MSKIILKWSVFSYIFTAILSITQQVLLTYYLTFFSKYLYGFFSVDVLYIIYILYNSIPRLVVVQGSKCWSMHTRLFLFKFIFIYVFVLPNRIEEKLLVFRGFFTLGTELSLICSLIVLVYILWIFQTGSVVFHGIRKISIEHMLHIELVIRVFIDLLDIIDASFTYLFQKNSTFLQPFVLFGFVGSLYFHGYSFPRVSIKRFLNHPDSLQGATVKNSDDSDSVSDVRYCRTNAIIVGLWLVDILIGSCRVASMYMSGKSVVSIFLIKNIISLFLYFGLFGSESTIPKFLTSNYLIEANLMDSKFEFENLNSLRSKISLRSKNHDSLTTQNYLWSLKDNRKNYFNKTNIFLSPSIMEYLYKLTSIFEYSPKTDLHHFLNVTCIKNTFKLRVILPYISFMFVKIFFVLLYIFILDNTKYDSGFISLYFRFLELSKAAHVTKFYGHVVIAMICFIFVINFLCFVTTTSLLDSIFTGLFAAIRFLSFICIISLITKSNLLHNIIRYLKIPFIEKMNNQLLLIFAIWPSINLLSNIYPFISLFWGKSYSSYVIMSKHNYGENKDQVVVMPTTSLILLITAQNLLLPKSMYKYFSSNFLLPTYRLKCLLSWVQLRRISIAIFIRLFFITVFSAHMDSVYVSVFLCHFLFLLYYYFATHIVLSSVFQKIQSMILNRSIDMKVYDESNPKTDKIKIYNNSSRFLPDLLF